MISHTSLNALPGAKFATVAPIKVHINLLENQTYENQKFQIL